MHNKIDPWDVRTAVRRMPLTAGMMMSIALTVQCHQAATSIGGPERLGDSAGTAEASMIADAERPDESLARSKPLEFLAQCWKRYQKNVDAYRCEFAKQEYIDGEIRPEQRADVRVLEKPFSVDMTFTKNVGDCQRALYVQGKWKDADGNELAWAKPAGAILRAFVPKIKQPIHGWRAKKASRRTIDQFGFDKSFELILKYAHKAQKAGVLDLRFVGEGQIDSRPTYVFERRLPYTGHEEPYPDSLLVIHVDKEWLVPTACYSYADPKGRRLLGSYVYTDVIWNPRYRPDDFDPDKIHF